MLIFDIETGPRSDDEIRPFCQVFDRTSVKGIVDGEFDSSRIRGIVTGEFDPRTVKLGALKDQEKIDAKITEAREKHEAAVAHGKQLVAEAREEHERAKLDSARLIADAEAAHWNNFLGRAALSPVTGQVLAIGYKSAGGGCRVQGVDMPYRDGLMTEHDVLVNFWSRYRACREQRRPMIGFNILKFDLPFLTRRSWFLGIDVPETLLDPSGRYFDRTFVDLMSRWQCGVFQDSISLDVLARFCGVGGKQAGMSGADFGRQWFQDRECAIEYLKNDLEMTSGCAARMGYV